MTKTPAEPLPLEDQVLLRMLKTPPKPHKKPAQKKAKASKKSPA